MKELELFIIMKDKHILLSKNDIQDYSEDLKDYSEVCRAI